MYMFWIGILIGIVAWQAISLIFFFLWQDDEDKALLATTGLAGGLLLLIIKITQCLNRRLKAKNFKAALVDSEGKACYCESKEMSEYLSLGYQVHEALRQRYTIEDGWNPKDCSWDVPNLRYTPMKILKIEQAYKLPRLEKTDA